MDLSVNQFPEQAARDNIDKQLHAAGRAIQDKDKIDWNESIGIAIRGYQTEIGPTDYMHDLHYLRQRHHYIHL